MKLTIKTIFGERVFDLPEAVATELIEWAESANNKPKPIPTTTSFVKETYNEPEPETKGYKGFLYIKCEDCGTTKGFCTSKVLTSHRCGCRHNTPLYDLATVKADCKCGESFTYKTNIIDPRFTMNCMACGRPINLELDEYGQDYITAE